MPGKKTRILITAGGTREYIDPVRFITNASSGQMGYVLAQESLKAGCKVTLISASHLQPPVGIDFVGVESAKEMFDAVKRFLPQCDCLIMAAAVADYTPARPSKTKLKKRAAPMNLQLKPTVDILAWAGKHKRNQYLVGFALEDRNIRKNAARKLAEKNLDMIIANTPATIGKAKTSLQIKTAAGPWRKLAQCTKTAAAKKIIALIDTELSPKSRK